MNFSYEKALLNKNKRYFLYLSYWCKWSVWIKSIFTYLQDQAQDHIQKIHKGDGGNSEITTNPEALFKYCLAIAELSHLFEEIKKNFGVSHTTKAKHHDISKSKVK